MSEYVHKSHHVTVLMYHLVFPAKYRRAVFDSRVDEVLKEVCLEIAKRYQIKFTEIGTDQRSCSFLGSVSADVRGSEDSNDDQKLNGKRDFQTMPRSEKETMGRRILDGRIFCEHGWQAW